MPANKRTIAERVNDYLVEPDGAQFVNNKWKFWFLAVAFLSIVNAALTWLIFKDDSENYSGPVMLSVGALVAWLCVCALHYTDGGNRQLARGVSAVDSIALLFVVIHFSGLLYVYGHHRTLRSAEQKFEQQAAKFNEDAQRIQDGNIRIAESAERISDNERKRAKLENDTAYQLRKAAEAGSQAARPSAKAEAALGVTPALSTSTIELERPVKPAESSAAFLTKWDWLIRAANCGELLLAVLTLILIRNVSAKTNTYTPVSRERELIPLGATFARSPAPVGNLTKKKEPQKNHGSFNSEGFKILREVLKDISFRLHKRSFKSAVRGDAVWVYLVRANHGTQETEASAKAKLSLLDDAVKMDREKFRERVERFLIQNGFQI